MTSPSGETVAAVARSLGIDRPAIARRKAFLEFGDQDIRLLKLLHEPLQKARRSFVDDFYNHLLKFKDTRRFIPDAETLDKLKQTQSAYFDSLTAGKYGEKYVHDRLRVGMAHARVGLEPQWYIGAYNKYLTGLLPEMWRLCGGSFRKFLAAYRALQKIVLLDMGLAIDTYIHADKEAIAKLKTYAESVIASLPVGVLVLDADLRVLTANDAFSGLVNRRVIGAKLDEILPIPGLGEKAEETLAGGVAKVSIEVTFEGRQLRIALTEMERTGEKHLLLVVEDVTHYKEMESRLARQATHDPLTGLPNRNLLDDRLTQAIAHAGRHQRAAGILFLDLDRFKVLNDSLGHAVGDELLRAVAARLSQCVRSGDTVARVGGDEFVVVLSDLAQSQDAGLVAQKIVESFACPFQIDVPESGAQEFFSTVSIGISLYPGDGSDLQTLLKHADTSMYRAKEQGGNCYQFFTAEMDIRARKRLELEREIHGALERDEFLLHYQPEVDLATGRIICVEALLRWAHPKRGITPPSEFIPLLEETGLIVPVGEWVLHAVGRQYRSWQKEGCPPVRVAVNLSARQLRDNRFQECVTTMLAVTGMPAKYLELEITESAVMQNIEQNLAILRRLGGLGVRLTMDDFGTGYSSLSHLKLFPLHTVKIAQSFVRDIPQDADDSAIALAVIALAHSLELKVVAEGAETEEQLSFLRAHGCDVVQGYLLGRPAPGAELVGLLKKGKLLPDRSG